MIYGHYTMSVDCDNAGAHVVQIGPIVEPLQYASSFEGRSRAECLGKARHAGWLFHRGGTTTCPLCAKNKRTDAETDARLVEAELRDEVDA
jgi:hypothetical protein